MGKKIINFFDKRAEKYLKNSNCFPWNFFRARELHSIEKLLNPNHGSTLLDIGCGAGFYSLYFLKSYKLKIMGIDSSPSMIQQLANQGVECLNINIEDFESGQSFDNIICAGALEFIESPESVFLKSSKFMINSGRFVILVPSPNIFGIFYKLYHEIFKCKVFLRNIEFYDNTAKNYGFIVEKIETPTVLSTTISFTKKISN